MAEEFPRTDPAATPEAPRQPAPSRKGMLVIYHGDGAGKETAALGVLFRAHGRELPVRLMRFAVTTPAVESGDDIALERLGIPADLIDSEGPAGATELWNEALKNMSAMREGVLVLEHLLDAIAKGWLSAPDIADALAGKSPLLHLVITGETAPPELIEMADLVTNMRAVKKRQPDDPLITGIDH